MTAAPFKATVVFEYADGFKESTFMTASDVAAAALVNAADSSTEIKLSAAHGPAKLVDISLTAAGTDTSNMDILGNGRNVGTQVMNAGNLYNGFSRQFQGAKLGWFPPGATVRFIQRA